MRTRVVLAIILLAVGLCLVSGVGYGEVKGIEWLNKMSESKVSFVQHFFLGARVDYIMRNPTSFLNIRFLYHEPRLENVMFSDVPESVDTKGKLIIWIKDNRGVFSDKSEAALLYLFEVHLKSIWFWIGGLAPGGMDNNVVAIFYSSKITFTRDRTLEGILGYFYQGEYHLWER